MNGNEIGKEKMNQIEDLLSFIRQSPTAFHAVSAAAACLEGFEELKENEPWHLVPGGRYYVTRNQSSIIAFVMPEGRGEHFQIVASHSDSPMFKVKENAELDDKKHYVRLDVEGYGGMIMSSWLDRPLSVAGRLVIRTPRGFESCLMDAGRDLILIPNVAIHMNREVNDGFKFQANIDTMPLWGSSAAAGTFWDRVAEMAGVRREDIIGNDLYVYNRMPGTVWGGELEFFSAPRIDNLECAYASLQALKQVRTEHHVNVCAVFDNEEVGSSTRQGAASTFLRDVISRILLSQGIEGEDAMRAVAGSLLVSADNAHATHPNHPEYADPANQVFMNEGIVLKYSARQKYTTDGVSAAVIRAVCQDAGVPVQSFSNRSDMPGGSTLGKISSNQVSIPTMDIGLAQLAMHSAYETAGVKDLDSMIRCLTAFYATRIRMTKDGSYDLERQG